MLLALHLEFLRARRIHLAAFWSAGALAFAYSGLSGCGTPAATDADATASPDGETAVDAAADVTEGAGPDVAKYVGKCAQGPQVCDDGNPCTVDDCDPVDGCLTSVLPCADSDPCTVDACDVATGGCTHVADSCEDDNACTAGSCDAVQGCIFAAADCTDGDVCTADGCSPKVGCLHTPLDCGDNLTCTADSCDKTSGCVHTQTGTGKCCEANSDCDDNNVCTAETCVAGLCQSQGVYGCCKDDASCDDKNACTVNTCDKGSGVCSAIAAVSPGCCQKDADCTDANSCTLDRCVHNACAHEATCCQKTADCGPLTAAVDACADATCTDAGCGLVASTGSGCCTPMVKSTGWEAADKWTVATTPAAGGLWGVETGGAEVKTGSGALVYRGMAKPTLGAGSVAYAKLAAVTLPPGSGATLTFAYYSQLASGEVAKLRVVTDAGEWYVWQQSSKMSAWNQTVVKLDSFAARAGMNVVQLQWEVAPSKAGSAAQSWFAVDDVAVQSSCAKLTCTKDIDCSDSLAASAESCGDGICVFATATEYCETSATCDDGEICTADSCLPQKFQCNHGKVFNCCHNPDDCDDANVCTTDYCNSSAQCAHATQPASVCCNSVADCNDANLCTIDTCPTVGLPCAHTQPDANCCQSAKDCNDQDVCTVDKCGQNQCSHVDVCCATAADCNDGDDVCTADSCVGQFCQHKPTGAAGCCVPDVLIEDMEGGMPLGWTATTSSATVHWQASQKQAHSGTTSLWWGDAAKGNYDDGLQNFGTLTSTPVDLPKGNTFELSFWVWVQTEGGSYDDLTLMVSADGKPLTVWQKSTDTAVLGAMSTWVQIKLNLSAFAGKKVTFVLSFDTKDSIGNSTAGVFVDDLVLHNGCAAPVCTAVTDCDDGLSATLDGCAAGQCTWAY